LQGAHGDGRLKGTNTVHKAPVYDNDIPHHGQGLPVRALGNSDAVEAGTGYNTAPRDISHTQKQFISDSPYTGAVTGTGGDAYKVTHTDVPHAEKGHERQHVHRVRADDQ
jgi:hypothetical protein